VCALILIAREVFPDQSLSRWDGLEDFAYLRFIGKVIAVPGLMRNVFGVIDGRSVKGNFHRLNCSECALRYCPVAVYGDASYRNSCL